MIHLETEYMGKKFYIDKDNGMYAFIPDAGKGKTYACYILDKLGLPGVKTVTYHNDKEKLDAEIEAATDVNKQYKLIFLDRADMYMTKEIYEKLLKISKDATVMIDLKCRPDYVKHTFYVASAYCGATELRIF